MAAANPNIQRDHYDRVAAIHARIVALYPTIRIRGVQFRVSEKPDRSIPLEIIGSSEYVVVNRDRAVCAIVDKAANLKESLRILCEQRQGDAALIIARTLLETAVVLEWLLQ